MSTFAKLFKKYRLRSEFNTIAAFSDALSDKGYFYEESIFYHWQKGTRVPTNRELILNTIKVFIEKGALKSIKEANEILESTQQGYLTIQETADLKLHEEAIWDTPFQVPSEIAHFTGREEVLNKVQKDLKQNNIFLLYGSPGVGKTALAIKLGHLLKNKFPDGVLWYKVDSSNIMDIFLSIAHLMGEDISEIKDVEVRASIVRTLLARKKLLLIFDNVTKDEKLHLLLPNNKTCCAIFSSVENVFNNSIRYVSIPVKEFTNEEVFSLFEKVFNKNYVLKQKNIIIKIAERMGHLPLAVHLVATHSKEHKLPLSSYLNQMDQESLDLHELQYEDKNLFKAIQISFNSLDGDTKKCFMSLGVFEGKDFSIEAVSYINKLSSDRTEKILQYLQTLSLIESSKQNRYRIHPMIKMFARDQVVDKSYYLKAATFYENLLTNTQDVKSKKHLAHDVDNIIYIFKKCFDLGYWDQVITLWNPLQEFLSETNEIKKLRSLTRTIDTSPEVNMLQKVFIVYLIFILIFWVGVFLSGTKSGFWNNLYGLLWNMIPFIGGFLGIMLSRLWGLFRTNIGKSIFFISAGVFAWGSGNMIWIYYNFVEGIDIPYPSFADSGYILGGLLWIVGIAYLSLATGARFSFGNMPKKIYYFVCPLILTAILIYFFIEGNFESNSPNLIIFGLIYPVMDIVILTLALGIFSLSVNFFSGKYKFSLFSILIGFIFLFIADLVFAYTTSNGMYYNGSFFEVFFNIALFLLSWGTLSFYVTPRQEKTPTILT